MELEMVENKVAVLCLTLTLAMAPCQASHASASFVVDLGSEAVVTVSDEHPFAGIHLLEVQNGGMWFSGVSDGGAVAPCEGFSNIEESFYPSGARVGSQVYLAFLDAESFQQATPPYTYDFTQQSGVAFGQFRLFFSADTSCVPSVEYSEVDVVFDLESVVPDPEYGSPEHPLVLRASRWLYTASVRSVSDPIGLLPWISVGSTVTGSFEYAYEDVNGGPPPHPSGGDFFDPRFCWNFPFLIGTPQLYQCNVVIPGTGAIGRYAWEFESSSAVFNRFKLGQSWNYSVFAFDDSTGLFEYVGDTDNPNQFFFPHPVRKFRLVSSEPIPPGDFLFEPVLYETPDPISVRSLPECEDGLDNDGDGSTDFGSDGGCETLSDESELGSTACDNGIDDDSDGVADFPADPGCLNKGSTSEISQCQDGLNNDNQLGIDFDGGESLDLDDDGFVDSAFNPATPAVGDPDPQCVGKPWQNGEGSGCGLGAELALVLGALAARRRAAGLA